MKTVAREVQLVNDQVENWSSRVINKLDLQFGENIGAFTDKSMAFKFEKIKEAVCKQLETIILEEDDEDRGFITVKDFMNDFGSDEFIAKNIRVRPMSGTHHQADDETKTQAGESKTGEAGDDEHKFNEQVNFDLQENRKQVKDRLVEHL